MTNGSETANCAHCGEPLPTLRGHVLSWRVGDRYACNEFCAEGVEEQAEEPCAESAASWIALAAA